MRDDEEFEKRLRDSFDRLPAPSDTLTRASRERALGAFEAVFGAVVRPSRRAKRGLAALAVALLGCGTLAGFALGRTSAPEATTPSVRASLSATGGPGFEPARGWNTAQTGDAVLPQAGSASAATVKLLDPPGSNPHLTLQQLGRSDVLIQVSIYGRADFVGSGWNTYPPRTLPLKTPGGDASANWEGGSGYRYVITGRVDGWLLEVIVSFGAQPSEATRRLADEELARLVLPSPCPAAQAISPSQVEAAGAAVGRIIPRAVDRTVRPPADYRDPAMTSRRATAKDTVPTQCAQVPRDRIVVVDVSYPALRSRPRMASRTYLVSRQQGRAVVWARTR
ncbi:MAG TPA: hypothetical protein VGM91_14580 [Conexibacter sp.]|jgi:hypothetical protein